VRLASQISKSVFSGSSILEVEQKVQRRQCINTSPTIFPGKHASAKLTNIEQMQYQSQKDRVISESIQEKKEKEDLLLLSRKISPRPRNQNKKLRNHNKTKNG